MTTARAVIAWPFRVWRYLYGAHPLHLLSVLGCFALVGYVVSLVYTDASAVWLLVWFVGAVIVHDLVLYPLYALADGSLVLTRWARRRVMSRPVAVPAINYVRLPALASVVLLLIYLPTVTRHSEDAFAFTAAQSMAVFADRWLLLTAVFFLGSAIIYAIRLGRADDSRVAAARAPGAQDLPPAVDEATVERGVEQTDAGDEGSGDDGDDAEKGDTAAAAESDHAEPDAADSVQADAESDDAVSDDTGHDDAGPDDTGHDDAGPDDTGHDDAGHTSVGR